MAKKQKQYTLEFKQQIVELYQTGNYSYSQLQSEYGVPQSTMAKWFGVRQYVSSFHLFQNGIGNRQHKSIGPCCFKANLWGQL